MSIPMDIKVIMPRCQLSTLFFPSGYDATMMQWLRARTMFQRVALVLMVLAVAGSINSSISPSLAAGTSGSGFVTVAAIIGYLAFRKELLWRVRNRLLVTFFLAGVIPIFLMAMLLMVTGEALLGQFATQHVRRDLNARIESVRSTAQHLALGASHGVKADALDGIRQRMPRLATVVRVNGDVLRLPPDGALQSAPAWIVPGFGDLFEAGGRYYIGADVSDGNAEVFAYLLLDEQTLASLDPGVVWFGPVVSGRNQIEFDFGFSGSRITMVKGDVRNEIVPTALRASRGWPDVPIAGVVEWQAQTSSGPAAILLPLQSRPSLLVAGVATGMMASFVFSLLAVVIILFLVVEVVSVFSSVALTRAITGSVDDLYRGTLRVAEGDFSHTIPVRGEHQLSALAGSFNSMTAKIHQLIGEVKKKEKMDAELEIARLVQLRLFPKSVPKLKTLEMAGICIPGRVVSGDYYDYVRLGDRWTVIVLGDVSGKGVSASLLMASMQAALHAQLKFGAAFSHSVLSIATLMESMGQQLYENTPPEKYATFFCSVYDDETGRLTYTNAGHLKPILVRDGQATTLAGDGMVVGLLPNVKYEQQDFQLQTGDLLAIFSDGIPEAEDAKEQEFGETHLAELLTAQASRPLEDIVAAVTGAVGMWIHDPEGRDDLTLLLLRKF
jgi:phosphoserine phosphatase RsbU/P